MHELSGLQMGQTVDFVVNMHIFLNSMTWMHRCIM